MRLKPGVRLHGLQPQMTVALLAIEAAAIRVAAEDGTPYEATITSVNDGSHAPKSLHWLGRAVDVRTRDLPDHFPADAYARAIRDRLPTDFDVVVESDHIHVEWDPVGKPG